MENNTKFKNFLRKNKIRIYTFGNKTILVDPYETAFMLFEPINSDSDLSINEILLESGEENEPTIKQINHYFRTNITAFPHAKRVFFTAISEVNLRYISDVYRDSAHGEVTAGSYRKRSRAIMYRHNVNKPFSVILASLPRKYNLYTICHDIREAHFYIVNNPSLKEILEKGYQFEKKLILMKILPPHTYKAMKFDDTRYDNLDTVVKQILTIQE